MTLVTAVAIVITVLAVALGGLYMSGYADDIMMYYAKRFYKAKAQAELSIMENVGEGKAKDFVKGMSNLLFLSKFVLLVLSTKLTSPLSQKPKSFAHPIHSIGQLKKNPLLGEDELEKIAPGLGQEAKAEGLAGVSENLGSLGGGKFGL